MTVLCYFTNNLINIPRRGFVLQCEHVLLWDEVEMAHACSKTESYGNGQE